MVAMKFTKPNFELRPIGDRVVIKVHKATETPSGIALPETAQSDYQTPTGEVLFVGPDCKYVKVGETVMCLGHQPAAKIYRDGFEWVTVHECDIIAVVISKVEGRKL